jgi:toxin ParE1/3/4
LTRPDWSSRAKRELDALLTYYDQITPDLAITLLDRIEAATGRLMEQPKLGPELPDSHVRKWSVGRTPFVILYRPTRTGVRILQIRDARSNWRPR